MLRRLLALLAVTIGMIVTVAATSTTTVGAASFAYDGPTIARVDAHSAAVVGAPLPLVTLSAEWTASTSVESQGPSTTLALRSVATEAESGLGLVCHSFDARTEVVMADGSRRPISNVRVGDLVRTTDPATGKAVIRPVTAVHINHDTDLADLTVRDGAARASVVHTTQHHRFWDDTHHGWVETAALAEGDRLHTDDGSPAIVQSVRTFDGPQLMYDLTVDEVHTYYIVAADEPVLVHNCGGLDALSESGSALDPADAGGQLTRAGRAFAKAGEVFGPTSGGPAAVNSAGQNALNEILINPGTVVNTMQGGNFAGGPVYISPDGIGAVFSPDGIFQYFGRMTP